VVQHTYGLKGAETKTGEGESDASSVVDAFK